MLLFEVIMSHRKYVKGKRSHKGSKQKSWEANNHKKMDRQQKPQQEVQQEPQVMPQVDFLSRVAKFPMVHSAMEYASDAYNKTKVSFHFFFFIKMF